MSVLSSKDNPRVRHWRRLSQDARYRRSKRRALIEGPHLLEMALQHGHKPVAVIATEKVAVRPEIACLRPVLVTEAVLRSVSDAETPQGVAAEIEIPAVGGDRAPVVFLEGIQDPANVGAIIRTAAAFGVRRVVLDRASADPWSPKALRAGMGGHFALGITEVRELAEEIEPFKGTLVCTVVSGGVPLAKAQLNGALGWIFGNEGHGVSEAMIDRADLKVTIPVGAGTESLNVAAAAAVCLYEASRSKSGSDPDFGQ